MKFKAKLKSLMMAGTFALCMNASVGVSPAYAICETNAEVITSQGNAITQQAQAVTQIIADLQASISSIIPVELTDLLSNSMNNGLDISNSNEFIKYEKIDDGFLVFTYGRNDQFNVQKLRPPQSISIQPIVGRQLIFPSWMQHMVYPFFGKGERRTVAANLNVWDTKPQEGEENEPSK